jgi:predicted nucleotidyltransferase
MQPAIEAKREEVAEICRRFHVRRLDVFGSAAREDFDPARSDVDFLVQFERDHPLGGLDAYFGLREALEYLFGRKVDLVAPSRLKNPYLQRSIKKSRQNVYAALLGTEDRPEP